MASKIRKVIVFFFCIGIIFSFSVLPCSAAAAEGVVSDPEMMMAIYDPLKQKVFQYNGKGNGIGTHIDLLSDKTYDVVFGVKFDAKANFRYSFSFHIGANASDGRRLGDQLLNSDPFGRVITWTDFKRLNTYEDIVSYLERTDNIFKTNLTLNSSNTGNSPLYATYDWFQDSDNGDYKTFYWDIRNVLGFTPDSLNLTYGLTVVLDSVLVAYSGNISPEILDKFDETTQSLNSLSNQVIVVANGVELAREDIANLKNYVAEDGAATRQLIEGTAKATQDAVNAAADQAHADAEKTQEAIGNVGEDVAQNIHDQEKAEGDKASSDANNQLSGLVSDIAGKDIDSKSWLSKFTSFWDMMGSTNVRQSFTLPKFEVFGYTFWDEQLVDLSDMFDYVAPLVKLVKFLLTLCVIWSMLRYFYNCVQFALGNSNLTLAQTIFSFNPFKIK